MSHSLVKREMVKVPTQRQEIEYFERLRDMFLVPKRTRHGKHGRPVLNVAQQILELNDARKARIFRPVPCRVTSAIKGQKHMGHTFISVCERSSHCENHTALTLAQSCDVLGPHACSDCIKERYRTRYTEETTKVFPELQINQRVLCARNRMKYMSASAPLPSVAAAYERKKSQRKQRNIEEAISEKYRKIPPVPSLTRVVTDNEIQLRVMDDVRRRPEEEASFIIDRRRRKPVKVALKRGVTQDQFLGPILVDSEKEASRKLWNVMPPSDVAIPD